MVNVTSSSAAADPAAAEEMSQFCFADVGEVLAFSVGAEALQVSLLMRLVRISWTHACIFPSISGCPSRPSSQLYMPHPFHACFS